ncbi:AAA family ATPase [Chitinophaga sp. RAB17]|uniref:AAA family ATPase n=1 Tax=Chitinophaga sp. RAB17 TaxID=3233049 RepID=UPI003F91A0AD
MDEPFELAQLTLFTGINGMGKSSVIQSLLLLKQSHASTVLQIKKEVDLWNFSFTDLQSADSLCNANAYPKTVGIEVEDDDKTYVWDIDASSSDSSQLPVVFTGHEDWQRLNIFQKDFIYISAERLGPRRQYSRKTERVFNTKLGIQGEATPVYIFDAINRNEQIGINAVKHPSLESLDFYENLNAWIGDILGREAVAKVSSDNKEEVNLSYGFKGAQGGNFSAMQVGFGYSFSLPVITSALICKKGDLLIIENPEAHLHPSAQSKIGMLLALVAQNGVQVIIETHSDHVVNGIRVIIKGSQRYGKVDSDLLRVHFFNYDIVGNEEHQTHRNLSALPNGKLTGWPIGFFDEWDNNLDKLID